MKNIMIIAAAVAGLSSIAAGAHAEQTDGTIRIDGTIAPYCVLTGGEDVGNIDLSSSSAVDLGNLNVRCNDAQGFTLSMVSDFGKLVDYQANGPTSSTTFEYKINASTIGANSVDATTSAQTLSLPGSQQWVEGQNIPLTLTDLVRTGPAYAGFYHDYLKFSVTAN